jgi:hypothetical protein
MTDLAAILERHYRRGHICDQANADIDALLKMIVQGPPLPPEAALHDAASAIDVARACFVNGEQEEGLTELKRASVLLRGLVVTP